MSHHVLLSTLRLFKQNPRTQRRTTIPHSRIRTINPNRNTRLTHRLLTRHRRTRPRLLRLNPPINNGPLIIRSNLGSTHTVIQQGKVNLTIRVNRHTLHRITPNQVNRLRRRRTHTFTMSTRILKAKHHRRHLKNTQRSRTNTNHILLRPITRTLVNRISRQRHTNTLGSIHRLNPLIHNRINTNQVITTPIRRRRITLFHPPRINLRPIRISTPHNNIRVTMQSRKRTRRLRSQRIVKPNQIQSVSNRIQITRPHRLRHLPSHTHTTRNKRQHNTHTILHITRRRTTRHNRMHELTHRHNVNLNHLNLPSTLLNHLSNTRRQNRTHQILMSTSPRISLTLPNINPRLTRRNRSLIKNLQFRNNRRRTSPITVFESKGLPRSIRLPSWDSRSHLPVHSDTDTELTTIVPSPRIIVTKHSESAPTTSGTTHDTSKSFVIPSTL